MAERTGCMKLKVACQTCTVVGLYRSLEAGITKDRTTPYAIVCEGSEGDYHGGVLCCETYQVGKLYLGKPLLWCDYCKEKKRRHDLGLDLGDPEDRGSSEGEEVRV